MVYRHAHEKFKRDPRDNVPQDLGSGLRVQEGVTPTSRSIPMTEDVFNLVPCFFVSLARAESICWVGARASAAAAVTGKLACWHAIVLRMFVRIGNNIIQACYSPSPLRVA